MVACPKCGNENPAKAKFCMKCGEDLKKTVAVKREIAVAGEGYIRGLEVMLASTGIYMCVIAFSRFSGSDLFMALYFLIGALLLLSIWAIERRNNKAWILAGASLIASIVLMAITAMLIYYHIPELIFPAVALYAYYKALPALRRRG